MAERVAVVGSRDGADTTALSEFLIALFQKYPDTVVVSGGNRSTERSVDYIAERTWLSLGGRVWSYRPCQFGPEEYGVEFWDLGGPQPRVFRLMNEPTWATYEAACFYRDMLIAEVCDRLAAFYKPGRSRGAGFTAETARLEGKPVYEYERSEAA